ncbi:MAG: porin family protein [Bacteroidota bacterium]|nr:porin family protein [Bacteroidota bacterium]
MTKNTLITFLLLTFLSMSAGAQRYGVPNLREYDYEPYHFGFLLAINRMDFSIKQDWASINSSNTYNQISGMPQQVNDIPVNGKLTSIITSPSALFTIGLVGSLRLSDNFDLRCTPSLSFGSTSLKYNLELLNATTSINEGLYIFTKTRSTTFIELPVMLRFSGARIQNTRPFIETGLKYLYDFSPDPTSLSSGTRSIDDPHKMLLKRSDLQGVMGLGFDFYFAWFKMGVDATMSYGFNDILDRDPVLGDVPFSTSSITSLKSKVFQLSVTFE